MMKASKTRKLPIVALALTLALALATPLTASALQITGAVTAEGGSGNIVINAKGGSQVAAGSAYKTVVDINCAGVKGIAAAAKPLQIAVKEFGGDAETVSPVNGSNVGRFEYKTIDPVAGKTIVYAVRTKQGATLARYGITFDAQGVPSNTYAVLTGKTIVNAVVDGEGAASAVYLTQNGYWPEPVTETPVALPYAADTGYFWEALSLTAAPAEGWKFAGWYLNEALVSTADTLGARLESGDVTYTARFVPDNPQDGLQKLAMKAALQPADGMNWDFYEGDLIAEIAYDLDLSAYGAAYTYTVPYAYDGQAVNFSVPTLYAKDISQTSLFSDHGYALEVSDADGNWVYSDRYNNNVGEPGEDGLSAVTISGTEFGSGAGGFVLGANASGLTISVKDSKRSSGDGWAEAFRVNVERADNPALGIIINGKKYYDGESATIAAPLAKADVTAPDATKTLSFKDSEGANAKANVLAGEYTIIATKVTGTGKNKITEEAAVTLTVTKAIQEIQFSGAQAGWKGNSKTEAYYKYNATVLYTDGSKETFKETTENLLVGAKFDKTDGKNVVRDTVEYLRHYDLTTYDAAIDVTGTISNAEGDGKTIALISADATLCDGGHIVAPPPAPTTAAELQDAIDQGGAVDMGGGTIDAGEVIWLGGDVSLNNGTVASSNDVGLWVDYDGSNVTLTNVGINAGGAYGVFVQGAGSNVTLADVDINAGNGMALMLYSADCAVTLEDVTVEAKSSSLYLYGSNNVVTVNGGSFTGGHVGSGTGIITTANVSGNKITVTGATFILDTTTTTSPYFVYLNGNGNIINFVDCTFIRINAGGARQTLSASDLTSGQFYTNNNCAIAFNNVITKGNKNLQLP